MVDWRRCIGRRTRGRGVAPRDGRDAGVDLLPVAGGAFAALGLRDAALGVAWPSVRETFDQPLAALGTS